MKDIKVGESVEIKTGTKPFGKVEKITKNFVKIRIVYKQKWSPGYIVLKKEFVKRDKLGKILAEFI